MNYSTIRIEGAILSGDILDKLAQGELGGQLPKDFGFDGAVKVKDEIARAWADARDLWRVFQRRRERIPEGNPGTSETRKFWLLPLLAELGYDGEIARAEMLNGNSYAISHRDRKRGGFPLHLVGCNDHLDKKRRDGGPRLSPHALAQEYLNLTEHLYAIVSNGLQLRLLRDSSRLVKLSFIEFNLEAMLEEEHFADFAVLYRLLHASRMPQRMEEGPESLIERYHQDALDAGSRIREGLSEAVERSIAALAEGFLQHPENRALRAALQSGEVSAGAFYQWQLRLIYRLLFLMVIEERNLIYPNGADPRQREIYYRYYSLSRLRRLSEQRSVAEARHQDLWIALKNTFRLFEDAAAGQRLGIAPLGGDLFSSKAIDKLGECQLSNRVLLHCLRNLNVFINKNSGQKMRVNYASLNVEEFGSVYEGLLEYDPVITPGPGEGGAGWQFRFRKGEGRAASGAHYTPDELVQPLIRHSLDYIIEEKLKQKDPAEALLSIKVCDVACGSGHILLNAARRIALELAKVRSGEEQPSPGAFRPAVRAVIRHCIYGVDINPLAVELCKVALWLEAHNPGEPLNFLDHRVKCGDAIVGLARREELERGIADEAFKLLPGDDKETAAALRKRNREERKQHTQLGLGFEQELQEQVQGLGAQFRELSRLPEQTPEQISRKQEAYRGLTSGPAWWRLKALADIQVGQFFLPRTAENARRFITDGEYRRMLAGELPLQGPAVGSAMGLGAEKHFFHWFLEFPEVFGQGGFDCILGNPPYLGRQALSGTFGDYYLHYQNFYFAPAGGCDLVTYFLRRIFHLIHNEGFNAIITTNSISEGGTRESGLDVILDQGGVLNFVVKSTRWPGHANLFVALLSLTKRHWRGKRLLDGSEVDFISAYFEDYEDSGNPCQLSQNKDLMFQGSIFLGDGFLLEPDAASRLIAADRKNNEVIYPVINGKDLNDSPDQMPSRFIINFFDWPKQKAAEYEIPFGIVQKKVKPIRDTVKRKSNRERWWIYAEHRPGLYKTISKLRHCFAIARTTKYLNFSLSAKDRVFTDAIFVFATEKFSSFAIMQSTLHNEWARKYSSSLETRLRYAPSDCFETFPLPHLLSKEMEVVLIQIGEAYHEHRRQLMLQLHLGLTKIYNLFHDPALTVEAIENVSKQPREVCVQGLEDLRALRRLHKEMDEAVAAAYDWEDLDLGHGFHEVDYLPENDRVRYTISPAARREVLKRLLALNHERHAEEVKAGLWDKGGKGGGKKGKKVTQKDERQGGFEF